MTNATVRWRYWLPIVQLGLAVVLSLAGKFQTERKLRGGVLVLDYNAPAELLLHSINYPAAVFTGITVGHRTFEIGIEYSIGKFVTYLVYIVAFWCSVGWCIDKYWRSRSKAPAWLPFSLALGGLFLLLIAFGMLRGPYASLLIASAFIWSVFFLIASATMFATRSARRTS